VKKAKDDLGVYIPPPLASRDKLAHQSSWHLTHEESVSRNDDAQHHHLQAQKALKTEYVSQAHHTIPLDLVLLAKSTYLEIVVFF